MISRKTLSIVALALCTLPLATPAQAAVTDACAGRLLALRAALSETSDDVTDDLVEALGAALAACPDPLLPQSSTPPEASATCRPNQHAEFHVVPVDLTISVLGETRLFRDTAERATLNTYAAGGHHTVDYSAIAPVLGVYGDNGGLGAMYVSFLVEGRGAGTAIAACDVDGTLCGGYAEANFLSAFSMKVQSAVSSCA